MEFANAFIDKYNMIVGAVVAILSYILGEHRFLFVAFLALNVADWLTGWMKSRLAGKENSYRMNRKEDAKMADFTTVTANNNPYS